jgi:alpha-1,4-digalacturonate transport system permease protein
LGQLSFFFNLLEPLFRLAQRLLGTQKVAWLFVAPNLAVFGVFTFLPIIINFFYAATAGVELMPANRPYSGLDNFETLLKCGDYTDLSTCNKDIFWRAVFNTFQFSLLQVGLMVVFSLITALVLNRKIIGRGFWRSVYFYPVLLSPVVVALIWKWLLQSQGAFNAGLVAMDMQPIEWLTVSDWAFFWTIFVSIWGFTP